MCICRKVTPQKTASHMVITTKGAKNLNAIIYARYSSHTQNEMSIDGQLKENYAYAKREGYTVIKEYVVNCNHRQTPRIPKNDCRQCEKIISNCYRVPT